MHRKRLIWCTILLQALLFSSAQPRETLFDGLARIATNFASEKSASLSMGLKFIDEPDLLLVNGRGPVPAASVIKLLVAVEVYRQAESGALSLDDKITMTEKDMVDGGPLFSMQAGASFTVGELVRHMLIMSDNTAANLLIDKVTMERVNECGRKLGMEKTVLQRKMMDFVLLEKGIDNITSAADMVLLLDRLVHGTAMAKEHCDEMLSILKRQHYRTRIPKLLPAGVEVANKTGELPGGIGCEAAVVWHAPRPYILCLFSRGLTEEDYAILSKSIYDAISTY
jgi:beta-lactamase class A